jgi:hypothetical protein
VAGRAKAKAEGKGQNSDGKLSLLQVCITADPDLHKRLAN